MVEEEPKWWMDKVESPAEDPMKTSCSRFGRFSQREMMSSTTACVVQPVFYQARV